jgi:D-arabinose 1-dehydrogenase-like Zn-dependent alcohol dehydrogenase
MRAFGRPLELEQVPIPTPGPGEVLVKIVPTGVRHTDLHAADGAWPAKPVPPFIPGHEGADIVAALGAGVTGLKEGDPVGIAWLHDACGGCEYCVTGWETLCAAQHNSGYNVNGTFTEYASRWHVALQGQGIPVHGAGPERRAATRRHGLRLREAGRPRHAQHDDRRRPGHRRHGRTAQ